MLLASDFLEKYGPRHFKALYCNLSSFQQPYKVTRHCCLYLTSKEQTPSSRGAWVVTNKELVKGIGQNLKPGQADSKTCALAKTNSENLAVYIQHRNLICKGTPGKQRHRFRLSGVHRCRSLWKMANTVISVQLLLHPSIPWMEKHVCSTLIANFSQLHWTLSKGLWGGSLVY